VLPAALPLLLPPAGSGEYPLVEAQPAFAERVLEALVGSRSEAVERDRDLARDLAHTYIYTRTVAQGAGYD
jgi:hypothetical protein